jgi:diguanylate cyclase (GGDEF)-like protein/PAS domain S-box-containing protein
MPPVTWLGKSCEVAELEKSRRVDCFVPEQLELAAGDAADLRVHQDVSQIEKENIRLRRALAEKDAALQRYAAFHEFSPVGFFSLKPDGTISQANLTTAHLLGLGQALLQGMRFNLFVAAADRPVFNDFLQHTFTAGGRQSCELELMIDDGPALTVQFYTNFSPENQECRVAMLDISARKATEEQIRHLALYDDLTQLPNRRLLLDRLQKALAASTRSGQPGALLLIDLDNFKEVNDLYGHDHGDLLLVQVAQRLNACIREVDTAARMGGDEFVVMLTQLSENPVAATDQAVAVGQKILDALNVDYELHGKRHHCTPSIGITLFAYQHQTIGELLKQADRAMYQAKAAGRNTLRVVETIGQLLPGARLRSPAVAPHPAVSD